MNLSDVSIKNPVFAWMLMAFLMVFGAISALQMGISYWPNIDIPTVTISARYQGASASVVDVEVTEIIERAISGVSGITDISSSSIDSAASIVVQFDINKNIDVAVNEIQNSIASDARSLPATLDPIQVEKSNTDGAPLIWMFITTTNLSERDLMVLVRERIADSFTTLPGVASADIYGYRAPNEQVWIHPEKLNQYELTALDVVNAIQNEQVEKPSGKIEDNIKSQSVRSMGEYTSAQDLSNLIIAKRGSNSNFKPVTLGQVATVFDGMETAIRRGYSEGKRAVTLTIQKQPDTNAVAVARAVRARVDELNKTLPEGTSIRVSWDNGRLTEQSIEELYVTLILAALLTALICLIFLGSFTATINVILAIPTSILGAFILMYAFGFTFNLFTMLALTLAIGIVVDDSIMVLENIVRHREMGEGRVEAARLGARQITLAATAATLAVIAIYLPVTLTSGIIGRFLVQFGVTLSIAVMLSLFEALTLTPMRCSRFLVVEKRHTWAGRLIDKGFTWLSEIYHGFVQFSLRGRCVVVVIGVSVFLLSLLIAPRIKSEFLPSVDQNVIGFRFQAPDGSSLDYTEKKLNELESFVSGNKNVEAHAGIAGARNGASDAGFLLLSLKPKDERELNPKTGHAYTHLEIMNWFREKFQTIANLQTRFVDFSTQIPGTRFTAPVDFYIEGPDFNQLVSLQKQILAQMQKSPVFSDPQTDYQEGATEIHLIPNREAARQMGVSMQDIASTMEAFMSGVTAGQMTMGAFRNDINVQISDQDRKSAKTLDLVTVRNQQGELVRLNQVVSIQNLPAPSTITRSNRQRAIHLSSNLGPGYAQADGIKEVRAIAAKVLPKNYSLALSGNAETFESSFSGLWIVLALGIVVSYMVLASQFNSFVHPFTVLISLPFSVSGALVALYLTNQTLNIYSMIALLLLMGIVKKNAILLVDFTNQKRKEGLTVTEALAEACPIRLRPILMTSIATITAAIPPALARGAGAESRVPMAVAVIGGMIVSTLLTLIMVPSVYSLMARLEKKSAPSNEL